MSVMALIWQSARIHVIWRLRQHNFINYLDFITVEEIEDKKKFLERKDSYLIRRRIQNTSSRGSSPNRWQNAELKLKLAQLGVRDECRASGGSIQLWSSELSLP